jgi:hypothetical protein
LKSDRIRYSIKPATSSRLIYNPPTPFARFDSSQKAPGVLATMVLRRCLCKFLAALRLPRA